MSTATMEERTTAIEVGWHEGLTMEEYLAIDAMSASGIEQLRKSPLHFRYYRDNPKPSTPAMELGTALHMALLEPLLFEGQYVTLGQCEAQKRSGFPCENQGSVYRDGSSYCGVRGHDPLEGEPMDPGVHVLSQDAMADLQGMTAAIQAHPRARTFFQGRGDYELTGIWRDEETGVLCKMRIDRDVERSLLIADLKSARDASPHGFQRDAAKMGYHRKAAFYRRGCDALGRERNSSVLIVPENEPPYPVAVYLLDEDDLAASNREITRHLNRYAMCLGDDHWPGYGDEMMTLKMPLWAVEQDQELNDG